MNRCRVELTLICCAIRLQDCSGAQRRRARSRPRRRPRPTFRSGCARTTSSNVCQEAYAHASTPSASRGLPVARRDELGGEYRMCRRRDLRCQETCVRLGDASRQTRSKWICKISCGTTAYCFHLDIVITTSTPDAAPSLANAVDGSIAESGREDSPARTPRPAPPVHAVCVGADTLGLVLGAITMNLAPRDVRTYTQTNAFSVY